MWCERNLLGMLSQNEIYASPVAADIRTALALPRQKRFFFSHLLFSKPRGKGRHRQLCQLSSVSVNADVLCTLL